MGLEVFIKVGYAVLVVSYLLMYWLSYCEARGAPCGFDPGCLCSSVYPSWGEVECHNSRLHLPQPLNNSKLFTLSLINNNLEYLPPRLLQGTGLSKLVIEKNPLYSLDEESLLGLDRVLWELHIVQCKLSSLPGHALRHLYRLKTLNLDGNEISSLNIEQLRGVSASLQSLILSNNRLTVIPSGVFSSLQALESLDLRGNSISSLDPGVFTSAPPKLRDLNLADNLFDNIPYKQLANIRSLRSLDLSYNHISKVDQGITGIRLTLDTLLLEYNDIKALGAYAMANFELANKTSMKANPLRRIEGNAFQGCRILELDLSECELEEVEPEAFNGLEGSLQVLNLAHNQLTNISYFAFNRYPRLESLGVDEVHLSEAGWLRGMDRAEEGIPLRTLHISGRGRGKLNLTQLPRLGALHTLRISNTSLGSLSARDLMPLTVELESLSCLECHLQSLPANTFTQTRGIKSLDLSENRIQQMDSRCFAELGHSLERLVLMHALASSVTALPTDLLRPLASLKLLQINHNGLTRLPEDISYLASLQVLHAHDNKIDSLNRNIFKSSTHKHLLEVNLSFNKISKIRTNTFYELDKLLEINLAENSINQIESGSFGYLSKLTGLSLRGNKISSLATETFQNIPCLMYLDLAYNSLNSFNFDSLDQVGSLSSLTVNVSHNAIRALTLNPNSSSRDSFYSSIKILDFSHNNISFLEKNYLLPVQHSLSHLYLAYNALENASREFLPEMYLLQFLDLGHNLLSDIEFDALRSARNLQTIILSHNRLKDLPDDLFLNLHSLRSVDLSHNRLYTVMDGVLASPSLAFLDLSFNDLTRLPLSSFSTLAASALQELSLRQNRIASLPPAEAFARFQRLRVLDLSSNKLTELGGSLSGLIGLSSLSLAHNYLHLGGRDFGGLGASLHHLDLTNVSISYVPSLPLPSLKTLRMAHNQVTFFPSDLAANLTGLKYLDVCYNELQTVPEFPQLMALYLAGNKITLISNASFNDFPNLYDLDIRHLPLTDFDNIIKLSLCDPILAGCLLETRFLTTELLLDRIFTSLYLSETFWKEESLTTLLGLQALHISNYKNVKNFNIPVWTKGNKGLRYLHVELGEPGNLGQELKGRLPSKVRFIQFTGKEIKTLPDFLLKELRSPWVSLSLHNTSVEVLPPALFSELLHVRNLSLDLVNNSLRSLANPCTGPAVNTPRRLFLTGLHIQDNPWLCDCQLGWIETWQRKRRQIYPVDHYTVEEARQTKCKNKQNKSLLEILRNELECGWGKGGFLEPTMLILIISICLSVFKYYTTTYS